MRALYVKKGFEGDLLERVVATICANKDVWVALMMAEEHELMPRTGAPACAQPAPSGARRSYGPSFPSCRSHCLECARASSLRSV